jgi:membrane-bound lytic murein transglycosylase B
VAGDRTAAGPAVAPPAWEHARVPDQTSTHPGKAPAVLLAAGLLLAACSAGGDQADRPAAAPTTTPATTTTSTVAPATTTSTTPPATPEARLAAQLTAAETAIRDPATPASKLPGLGHAQQRAYRAIIRQPRLLPEVLPLVPPALRRTVEANVMAGSELRKLSRPRPRLPRWRIVAAAPAARLLADYRAAEAKLGVPWQYLAAIHLVETRVGRIRGTSTAGAQGPMQFLPPTWRRYGAGGDINASRDAILAAARLLRANGAPGDMAAALYAYNHSGRYVRAVTAYAEQMRADQRAFLGYYHWQVYYGDILLPEGYPARPADRNG